MNELFNVVEIFDDETNQYVLRYVQAQIAMDAAMQSIVKPAAKIGIIDQVMVTDMLDNCCFHWQFGKGILFPTIEQIEASRSKQ